MPEIIPYIILILVLLALEILQIAWAKSKIKKWILPILSFAFSLYIMAYLISFELSDTWDPVENPWKYIHKSTLMMFLILNIPTIIFVLTNIVMKVLDKRKAEK